MAPHLFDCWAPISRRVRSAASIRLFLDFDGTLVPFRATPQEVTLDERTRRALTRVLRHGRVRVAIVSGRRRGDLIERIHVQGVQYWGLYGWERRPGRTLPRNAARAVSSARDQLIARLKGLRGVWVEDKELGFSVHVPRASSNIERRARTIVRRALRPYGAALHMLPGYQVWNVLPRQVAGKGVAVREALRRTQASFLPIYVGDDATDEPAFGVLSRGITVKVGTAPRTRARYRVSDPDEVRAFLERLNGELS